MMEGGDTVPVEQVYHREKHREKKSMDSKQSGAKFSSNILSRVFDEGHSVGSTKSGKPLRTQLLFQNAAAKVVDPIGEASLSNNYPLTDKSWSFVSHHRMPTSICCPNMRKVTSNPSTRSSSTKMLSIRSLNRYSRDTKVVMKMRPLNRSWQPFSTFCSASIQVYARQLWPEMEA